MINLTCSPVKTSSKDKNLLFKAPVHRVVPVNKNVSAPDEVMSYEMAEELRTLRAGVWGKTKKRSGGYDLWL
jgi:hypothetical protein